ncbi:MAG: restriction endonuclease subunit S, partial [Prevotella sp.]|nr:restriction endonuclease subunit S [Prevotella sp.]
MENAQWKKMQFDKFFDMLPTNTLSRDKLNNQRGDYQNIHYGDVLIKYPYCLDCNNNEIPYINDDIKFNATEVKDGDVIFADTAEDDTVGKCVEVLNVGDRRIVSGLHTYFCRPKYKMAPGYLGYFLNSNHFHNQLLPYIAGSKVSSVNRTSISRTYISYPDSLPAQRHIADILSSADKVIASTQKVIAKYKQMKQGLMEDLLKPKEGWKMVRLGEVVDVFDGTHQTPYYVDNGIPFYSVENVTTNEFEHTKYITEEEHLFLTQKHKIEQGDILMTRIGSIGVCKLVNWEVNASFYVSLALLKIKEGFDAEFLVQYSQTEAFKKS